MDYQTVKPDKKATSDNWPPFEERFVFIHIKSNLRCQATSLEQAILYINKNIFLYNPTHYEALRQINVKNTQMKWQITQKLGIGGMGNDTPKGEVKLTVLALIVITLSKWFIHPALRPFFYAAD